MISIGEASEKVLRSLIERSLAGAQQRRIDEESGIVTAPTALARRRVIRAAMGGSGPEFSRACQVLSSLLDKDAHDDRSKKY